MPDYSSKVYREVGGDKIVVESGGAIQVKTGGKILNNAGTQAAALTPPAGTYATNSTPYGFTQDQANALIAWVIAADAALKAAGITA